MSLTKHFPLSHEYKLCTWFGTIFVFHIRLLPLQNYQHYGNERYARRGYEFCIKTKLIEFMEPQILNMNAWYT